MNPLMQLEEDYIEHLERWNKDYDSGADKSAQKGLRKSFGSESCSPARLGEALNIESAVAKFQPYPFPRLERHVLELVA